MRDAGVKLVADSTTWAVSVFWKRREVPSRISVLRRLGSIFDREKPDVFVPVVTVYSI